MRRFACSLLLALLVPPVSGHASATSHDATFVPQPISHAIARVTGDRVSSREGRAAIPAPGVAPQPAPAAAAEAATPGPASGSVTLRFFACGAGVLPAQVGQSRCSPTDRIPDLVLFPLGGSEPPLDMADAQAKQGSYTWSGLPDGSYGLGAVSLPDGFDLFYVAGLDGLDALPGDGFSSEGMRPRKGPSNLRLEGRTGAGYTPNAGEEYIVPIDGAHGRSWNLNLYLIRTTTSIDLGFRFWQCSPGVTAQPEMSALGCTTAAPPAGFDIELWPKDLLADGPADVPPLTFADADRGDPNRLVMRSLAPGPWVLSGTPPAGLFGFAMRSRDGRMSIWLKEDRSGYELALAPEPGEVATIDVYLLAPAE